MVTHDSAPMAQMSILRLRTPPQLTLVPSTANRLERRHPGQKVQLTLDAFLRPPSAPLVHETDAVLTGETSPLVPNPQPKVQPNLLPRWQAAAMSLAR